MTAVAWIERYAPITREKKGVFLSVIAYELTISARMHYEPTDSHLRQVLIGINELQHHLSAEARHLIEDEEKRYPDDVLARILMEKATNYGIAAYLERAIDAALRRAN